jgi:Fic-DOC domain mobile mystery protein B
MSLLSAEDGNTPLTPDELADLIPNLATREELNEWERENILGARRWALARRNLTKSDPISDGYIRKLHARMFDQTWKWAGEYRKTEKTIGVPVQQMREMLVALLGDTKYWMDNNTYAADEIAIRFHHRLVLIHLFPNGNGRHARLIADVIALKMGKPFFSWGGLSLVKPGEAREQYLQALRVADTGDIAPLATFARS